MAGQSTGLNLSRTNSEESEESFVPTYSDLDNPTIERPTSMSNIHVVHQRRGKPEQRALLFCHFLFKSLALIIYLFSGLWGLGYITTFVIVVMLLSIDFWLVKNLSGRLLAGLRWWSVTDDYGQMQWRFEGWTPEERQIAYKSQVHLFWIGIITQQITWTILLLSALFGLKLAWMVIGSIAFSLNGANVLGYIRCRLNQRNQEAGFLTRIRDSVVGLFKPSGYMRGEPIYTG